MLRACPSDATRLALEVSAEVRDCRTIRKPSLGPIDHVDQLTAHFLELEAVERRLIRVNASASTSHARMFSLRLAADKRSRRWERFA